MTSPLDLRTQEGIAELVMEQYQAVSKLLRESKMFLHPSALLFVHKSPSGALLERPALMSVSVGHQPSLDLLISKVRDLSVAHQACGVLLTLPVVVLENNVEDVALRGEALTATPKDLHLCFVVEHRDGKIGRPCWIAPVRETGHTAEVGPLQKQDYNVIPAGALGELLPVRLMN